MPVAVQISNDPEYHRLAKKAWRLWNQATEIADSLWNEFEPYFIDKCIEMNAVSDRR